MALDNIVDLKLNLTATDDATDQVSTLLGVIRDLVDAIGQIAEPAAAARDAITEFATGSLEPLQNLQDAVKSLGDTWTSTFGSLPASATAVQGALDEVASSVEGAQRQMEDLGAQSTEALDAVQEGAAAAADELSGALSDSAKTAQDAVEQLAEGAQGALADVQDAVTAVADELNTALDDAATTAGDDLKTMAEDATAGLKTLQEQAEQTAAAISTTVSAASGGGALGSAKGAGGFLGLGEVGSTGGTLLKDAQSTISGVISGAMQGAMGLFMGGMGVSMLAQQAMGMADLQAVMKAGGPNTSPQQAAQYMALLGMANIAPTSAPSFISEFSAKLQNLFKVTGTSGLPRQALLAMQAGGFSLPQLQAESPINQLQSVQSVYAKLMASGQSQAGGELLGQLGLTQFATLFQGSTWSTAQQSLAGIGAGLTSAQVNSGAKAGVTLEASIAKLQMTFMTFAAELAPEAQKIVTAVQDIIGTFSGKGNAFRKIVGAFQDIGKNLGGTVEVLVGVFVAAKALGAIVQSVTLGRDLIAFGAAIKSFIGGNRGGGGGLGGGGLGGGGGGALGAANCLNICQDSAAQIGTETAGAMAPLLSRASSMLPTVAAVGGTVAAGVGVGALVSSLPSLTDAMANLNGSATQLTPSLTQATASAQQMGVQVPLATQRMGTETTMDVQGMATSTQAALQQWSIQSQAALQQFSLQSQGALTTFATQAQSRLQSWAATAQAPVAQFATGTQAAVTQGMTAAQNATTTAMSTTQTAVQTAMAGATTAVQGMQSTTTPLLNTWQAQASGDVTSFTTQANAALQAFATATKTDLQTWQAQASGDVTSFTVDATKTLQSWAATASATMLEFATSSVQAMIAAQAAIGQAQGQQMSPSGLPWGEWQSQQMQDFMQSMGLPASSTEPNPWGTGVTPTVTGGGTASAAPTSSTGTSTSPTSPLTGILSTLEGLYSQATGAGMPGSGLAGLGGLAGAAGGLVQGLLGAGGASAFASGFSDTGNLNSSQAQDIIQQAIGQVGASASWAPVLQQLLGAENASMQVNAVNPQAAYYNQQYGMQNATGLFQMMPPTFNEYAMPGETDINNPLDNAVAALRDILAQFQTIPNFYKQTGLGTSSYTGYASGGLLTEPVMGIGTESGQQYMFGEAGPEYFIPASGGGASPLGAAQGGGGATSITITVNAPGNAALNRAFAQQIGQQIVQSLKLKGNYFDMANA